jgi:hypothetical protein
VRELEGKLQEPKVAEINAVDAEQALTHFLYRGVETRQRFRDYWKKWISSKMQEPKVCGPNVSAAKPKEPAPAEVIAAAENLLGRRLPDDLCDRLRDLTERLLKEKGEQAKL